MTYQMNLRRYRQTENVRKLFRNVHIQESSLIQPYFVYEKLEKCAELESIHGQKMHNVDSLIKEINYGITQGITNILLFFIPSSKSVDNFDYSFDLEVLKTLKKEFGNKVVIFTDLCLCSQTVSGHCGILEGDVIVNDKTVEILADKALAHAKAGSDCISPSDMMDNRILAIREILDENGYDHTMIMSYSTKFSSNFYGPFRDAADSAPSKGDRRSYQIDYRNTHDSMLASLRDMDQGADILMVKPAAAYLDVISKIKGHEEMKDYPLAAYQVSGEYQGLYVMAQAGLLDFKKGLLESLYAIKRSGADIIITYAANEFRKLKGEDNE